MEALYEPYTPNPELSFSNKQQAGEHLSQTEDKTAAH